MPVLSENRPRPGKWSLCLGSIRFRRPNREGSACGSSQPATGPTPTERPVRRVNKIPTALKHGGYCATALLPAKILPPSNFTICS
jgi:hypothetical protein